MSLARRRRAMLAGAPSIMCLHCMGGRRGADAPTGSMEPMVLYYERNILQCLLCNWAEQREVVWCNKLQMMRPLYRNDTRRMSSIMILAIFFKARNTEPMEQYYCSTIFRRG